MSVQIRELEERSKVRNAFGAILDIKRRDRENIDTFSTIAHSLADKVYADATSAYMRSRVYKNFRKGFIAVKVEAVQRADKMASEVDVLNAFCADNGIEIVSVGEHLIYRIK